MASRFYDFIIVGAGPAGLTAGIIAAKKGFNVIVLEKGSIAGPNPRGEGIEHFPLIDELFGDRFLPLISTYSEPSKVYHSPGDIYQVEVERKGLKHYFFPWREFIDRFVKVAKEEGVDIHLNSYVIEPIIKDEICVGVRYKDKNETIHELSGNVVFGCDGFDSIIGTSFGIQYDRVNCPMIKCIVKNAQINTDETPGLQFYFIGNGDLAYAPQFPPCVAYVFPIGGTNIEIGLMLRMMTARNMKTVRTPTDDEILNVWEHLKKEYPGFSTFLKGSTIEYEKLTALPNTQEVSSVIPHPGAVLIGDSAGFIDASDSSGLYASMYMAKFWVELIGEKLTQIKKGKKKQSEYSSILWSKEHINTFLRHWDEDSFHKHIKKVYRMVGMLEWYAFKHRRTAKRMNNRWKFISMLLKRGL